MVTLPYSYMIIFFFENSRTIEFYVKYSCKFFSPPNILRPYAYGEPEVIIGPTILEVKDASSDKPPPPKISMRIFCVHLGRI